MGRKRIYKSRQTIAAETSPRLAARSFGIKAGNVVALVAAASLLVGYLALSTQSAAKGFMIRALERKISSQREEGDKLEVDVAGKQAMQNVSGEVQKFGFVPVSGIQYVSSGEGAVAAK